MRTILLQHLLYFYELSQHQTISQAAQALHTTQSNLSQAMINLEAELDLILLNRTNKGVNLTPEGKLVLKFCLPILENIHHITSISHGKEPYFINVGSYPFILPPGIMTEFYQIYDKQITLTIQENSLTNLFKQLTLGKIELAFIQLTDTISKSLRHFAHTLDLVIKTITFDQFSLVIRPDHPLAPQGKIYLSDLANFPLISLPTNNEHQLPRDNFMLNLVSAFDFKQLIYLNSSQLIITFLKNFNACFIVPSFAQENFSRANLLCRPITDLNEQVEIALVKKEGFPLSTEAKILLQLFQEQFKR